METKIFYIPENSLHNVLYTIRYNVNNYQASINTVCVTSSFIGTLLGFPCVSYSDIFVYFPYCDIICLDVPGKYLNKVKTEELISFLRNKCKLLFVCCNITLGGKEIYDRL